jgi:CDGSH-type Zn-finger protein
MAKITINAMKDGPCIVNVDGEKVAALCRCGSSANKPRCDGAHAKTGFTADEAQIEA